MKDLTHFLLVIGKLSSSSFDSLRFKSMLPECVSFGTKFDLVSCTSQDVFIALYLLETFSFSLSRQ